VNLIDSHCHLSNLQFKDCLSEIIKEANQCQIHYFLQASYNPEDWAIQIELCNKYKGILPVFGLHPEWVANCSTTESATEIEMALDQLAKTLKYAYAIGEVGLDLRAQYEQSFTLQMETCEKQIELAHVANLPLVFHIVRAHHEFLNFLDYFPLPSSSGFIHSFNGSWETAKAYLDKGLLISISGSLSYGKNKNLREAVKKIPRESLLIESDCPDQIPTDWNTEPYTPNGIWNVAKLLGELRSESAEELLSHSSDNLRKLLKLNEQYS
jgi:TatD DNase family protein